MIFGSLASHDAHSLGLFFQLGQLEPLLEKFTVEEENQMKRMLQRMDLLVKVNTCELQRLIAVTKYTRSSNLHLSLICKEQALIV